MRKLFLLIPVLIALGAAAYFGLKNDSDAPTFRTEEVARGDISASVTASGSVNAVITVLVGTQVSGTIKAIHADFNSKVRKNQVIALIDPATFDAQVAQARANVLSARANLDKAKSSLLDAQRTMERSAKLVAASLISDSDYDSAVTAHDLAKAQVNVAEAQVAQAVASLTVAETNLRYTSITSPVDGVVISRNVDVGQTVAASFQTPTLFTIAQDLTKMQIDSNVAEADIGRIVVGQPVDFTVDAYPERVFKGVVSEVRNAPITVQNVVTYDAVVKVDNSELKLKPGMTANVTVIVANRAGVLKIPNSALRFSPPSPGPQQVRKNGGPQQPKGRGVWVLDGGKPKRIAVKLGISDGNYTELLSDDIKEHQGVIVEAVAKGKDQKAPVPTPRMF